MVTVLPPHVVHDGRTGPSGRFRRRVLNLDGRYLDDDLIGHAVDAPTISDPRLRRAIDGVHARLSARDDPLETETHLTFVAERLRRHLVGRPRDRGGTVRRLRRARELLDAARHTSVTLADLSACAHVDPTHLGAVVHRPARHPTARVRARAADRRGTPVLLEGRPPGAVAAEVGCYDQAHLTRHFKRHVGTTPGRFARAGR